MTRTRDTSYVLDPRLQDGKKIPKWEPCSQQGQFLGFSKEHATTIGLIRNTRTGYISPQFHVVYDEQFTIVTSDSSIDLQEHWIDLFLNSRESYLDVHDESVDGPIPELDMEYQPPDPREYSNQGEPQEHVGQGEPSQTIESPTLTQQPSQPQDDQLFDDFNAQPQRASQSSSLQTQPLRSGSRVIEVEVSPSFTEQEEHNPEGVPQSPFRPRGSTRPRSQWNEPPLTYDSLGGHALLLKQVRSRLFDYVVLSTSPDVLAFATLDWETVTNEPLYAHFHKLFARQINPDTLELFGAQDAFHPFAFSAKLQSEDFPTYSDILCMEPIERAKWLQAMDQEINDLLDRNTFELVPRSEPNSKNEQVIKSMWAFRRKRKPNGEISRYKARLVVRGNLQRASSNYSSNETFAPVVEWSTVRMLFTLGVIQDWKSASIDFRSALTQDCLLCLYVDDAILHAREDKTLDEVLNAIAQCGYTFDRDKDFNSYLGVQVDHNPDGSKTLSQPGLARQLLDMMGMQDCNPSRTPMSNPLFAHATSDDHNGSFNYRSAIGMMMYLVNNTRPECAFSVNSCAQYSIAPKVPHAEAVRQICRYVKGTVDRGITIKPKTSDIALHCYVDADYAGHWISSEADSPETVKSRAGYIISLGNAPVLWKSKRIHELCLSIMESEYIALSMAMRSLVYLRGLMFEIDDIFGLGVGDSISTISTVFEDNASVIALATTDPPRMTPRSKSLHWP
eukprot:scaffold3140_cov87-Amphora_coffeaeformis.AAC.1